MIWLVTKYGSEALNMHLRPNEPTCTPRKPKMDGTMSGAIISHLPTRLEQLFPCAAKTPGRPLSSVLSQCAWTTLTILKSYLPGIKHLNDCPIGTWLSHLNAPEKMGISQPGHPGLMTAGSTTHGRYQASHCCERHDIRITPGISLLSFLAIALATLEPIPGTRHIQVRSSGRSGAGGGDFLLGVRHVFWWSHPAGLGATAGCPRTLSEGIPWSNEKWKCSTTLKIIQIHKQATRNWSWVKCFTSFHIISGLFCSPYWKQKTHFSLWAWRNMALMVQTSNTLCGPWTAIMQSRGRTDSKARKQHNSRCHTPCAIGTIYVLYESTLKSRQERVMEHTDKTLWTSRQGVRIYPDKKGPILRQHRW